MLTKELYNCLIIENPFCTKTSELNLTSGALAESWILLGTGPVLGRTFETKLDVVWLKGLFGQSF